jgi:NAD-specific glutamate dehydrogenase
MAIDTGLDAVSAIDDDRILRTLRGVVLATLRTNALRPPREALAFKIDSALVPGLPQPLPWREIWVYSPASRASICAPARSRAAGCAGPIAATISAPRSSA